MLPTAASSHVLAQPGGPGDHSSGQQQSSESAHCASVAPCAPGPWAPVLPAQRPGVCSVLIGSYLLPVPTGLTQWQEMAVMGMESIPAKACFVSVSERGGETDRETR